LIGLLIALWRRLVTLLLMLLVVWGLLVRGLLIALWRRLVTLLLMLLVVWGLLVRVRGLWVNSDLGVR
jgi:hypothetical protein